MPVDMQDDIFGRQPYGKAALKKMGSVPANFRIYRAGWVGDLKTTDTMEVIGAEFREAKSGPNKGKLSILVPGTRRTVYVNKSEFAAAQKPVRPACAVQGQLGSGAMCGQVIVGLKECGAELGSCKHQVTQETPSCSD